MDLIGTLTQQLGVNPDQAQGLAGGVLGMIKSQVADKVGPEQAAQMADKIPELGQWADKAKALSGAQEGGGGLMGALGGLVGGGGADLGSLSALVGGAGLDMSKAQSLVPAVLEFLKGRLDGELMQKILSAVPLLQGLTGGESGGLMGTLGGLLGKS